MVSSTLETSTVVTLASLSNATLPVWFWLAPIGGVAALVMARLLAASVMKRSEGDEEMVRIAAAVREGAMAYLRRQGRVVAIVFVALSLALLGLYLMGLQPFWSAIGVPMAGLLSGLCGWFGMRMATNASARTAYAAKQSLNEGLQVAFRAGAVMGLTVVGLAILDVSFWVFLFITFGDKLGLDAGLPEIVAILVSYKMGASLQALFARVGGGIYTKAADVGADLVGKVEAGIPEDDARNPAVVADNVGDNVGDVAGMGADLYESYYSSVIAALALGVAAALTLGALPGGAQTQLAMSMAVLPMALAGAGIFFSILGIFSVRTREDATFGQLLSALHKGVNVASVGIGLAAIALPWLMLGRPEQASTWVAAGLPAWWGVSLAIGAGLIAGLVIAWWTERCTSYEHAPTRRIALQAMTGPATVIIAGIAEGMKSTWASLLAVVAAILVAFIACNGGENFLMGLYGVGIAAVGMLATLGITLATDAYGPIADNAGGNAEMSGQPPMVRERTDKLDSLGNTTAATGKGFAIGSAALTAMALLAAYVQVVQTQLYTQTSAEARTVLQSVSPPPATEAVASYLGNGRFSVNVPAKPGREQIFDGALLIDRSQVAGMHFDSAVKPGQIFTVEVVGPGGYHAHAEPQAGASGEVVLPDALQIRGYILEAAVAHGDHAHNFEIFVISARNATIQDVLAYYDVTLANPRVLGGLFIGVMVTFLFCALTMNAVGRAAYAMMGECRRQFGLMREALRRGGMSEDRIADPTNWPKRVELDGKHYPDYATCVSIATGGALREMLVPSALAVFVPVATGLVLNVAGVVGLLAGGLTAGFAVAVFMANAGGAWDNAKKLIESYGKITADQLVTDAAVRSRLPEELVPALVAKAEDLRRQGKGSTYIYGKGSDDHKAAVVGDTVGDPFKDTSGPALNILIKLLSSVAVVFAGLTVSFASQIGALLGLN